MKKVFLKFYTACALVLILNARATAQFKMPAILLGANASYSNPQGSFADQYKLGLGGEIYGGVGFGKTFIVATVGTSAFFAENKNSSGTLTYKPMKVGIRQYLFSKRIFVNADFGTASIKDKSMTSSESRFTRGIGAGARFLGLEGGLYYDGWKNADAPGFSNSVQVKVGWSISL